MNHTEKAFIGAGEFYAAGFFQSPERSRFYRFCEAHAQYLKNCSLNEYRGGGLYPCGRIEKDEFCVHPDFSYTLGIEYDRLSAKSPLLADIALQEMLFVRQRYYTHAVGGNCYTHFVPNYCRILKEGFNSYIDRINKIKDRDFREGLLTLLDAIDVYRRRCLEYLKSRGGKKQLVAALENVPFNPARDAYEAIVCINFIYYLDFCDNIGRLDADLAEYFDGGDYTALFRELFENIDDNDGWTGALGPDCSALTVQILNAAKGMRRPSLELRIDENTPDEVWNAAAECIAAGGGQPSLYNENLYQQSLKEYFPRIPAADLKKFCGGGCTESMLEGLARVGSLDAGINAADIFSRYMREQLNEKQTFEDFYRGFISKTESETAQTLKLVNEYYRERAEYLPQPMRTLLADDCIDREKDFNAGGARYNWSVINFAGLINVLEAMLSVKELIFEKRAYTAEDFIQKLDGSDELLLKAIENCPHFGRDDDCADSFGAKFFKDVFSVLDDKRNYFGERFLPSSIQFTTYADAGLHIPATADGRKTGAPLADSVGAIFGYDSEGPTALLNSVAKLGLKRAAGTPVLNLKLQKKYVKEHLKALITGFFESGGMQVQITCVSAEDLKRALLFPEEYKNLIVRIGGYAEYFNRLSPELKKTVIERTLL